MRPRLSCWHRAACRCESRDRSGYAQFTAESGADGAVAETRPQRRARVVWALAEDMGAAGRGGQERGAGRGGGQERLMGGPTLNEEICLSQRRDFRHSSAARHPRTAAAFTAMVLAAREGCFDCVIRIRRPRAPMSTRRRSTDGRRFSPPRRTVTTKSAPGCWITAPIRIWPTTAAGVRFTSRSTTAISSLAITLCGVRTWITSTTSNFWSITART